MTIVVRVPVEERDVFGRDLNVARARLDQTPGQQAALPEAARVVGVIGSLRLQGEIECLSGGRAEEAVRVVERAQQRLSLVVAPGLGDGAVGDQPLVELGPALEPAGRHPMRWADGFNGLIGEGQVEGAELSAQKARRRECFQFLAFAQIEALPDVDEGRDGGVFGAECPGDDRAEVRRGDGLGRSVAGVPLVLVAGM